MKIRLTALRHVRGQLLLSDLLTPVYKWDNESYETTSKVTDSRAFEIRKNGLNPFRAPNPSPL